MKKKKKLSFLYFVIAFCILFVFAIYFSLAVYYKDGFSYGTWINGIYCTGKSVEEVSKELHEKTEYQDITVTDMEGITQTIPLSDIEYKVDYESQLLLYLERQKPFLWIDNLFGVNKHTVNPVVYYNEDSLKEEIENLSCVKKGEACKNGDILIKYTQEGYILEDTVRNIPDEEKITQAIFEAFYQGQTKIVLDNTYYKDEVITPKMEQTLTLWEKIEEYQNSGITYDMGDEMVPIDAGIVSKWIKTDDAGNFVLDEENNLVTDKAGIEEFIKELALEFDTYGKVHTFQSTRGDVVEISGGTYGNKLNQKAEVTYLEQAFKDKVKEVHTPTYERQAQVRGKNDIGDTYIEIDMTEQMMYFYQMGEEKIKTPVVTGNTGRKMGTKQQVSYIYGKQKNRTLVGPDYRSFVNYWMPVNGNVGIHDATWRDEFGEEIYKKAGSHGCINTPYDAMKELYDMVEVGTPVILFY